MSYKFFILISILASSMSFAASPKLAPKADPAAPIYTIPVQTIDGKATNLAEYKGKVMLIVNTASQCGFTPQYAGLESVYEKYKALGLVVLGFPSNDFGGQEPGTEAEIKKFCELKYKTTFPLYSKVEVKKGPLYSYLQKETSQQVGWNFGKFLVNRDGKILAYYPSKVTPTSEELAKGIEQALNEKK